MALNCKPSDHFGGECCQGVVDVVRWGWLWKSEDGRHVSRREDMIWDVFSIVYERATVCTSPQESGGTWSVQCPVFIASLT